MNRYMANDLETMPMDQLRALATADAAKAGEPPIPTPEPAAEPTPELAPEPPVKFTRTIEINGQKRTFEADTQEGLIDQLLRAQESAARKIAALKEQMQTAAPTAPAPIPTPKSTLSADELFQLSQEVTTDPASAFSKLLKAQTGLTPEQLTSTLTTIQRQQAALTERIAAESWVKAHPDYVVSQRNAKYLLGVAQAKPGGLTYENLEAAYEELVADNVLELRSSDPAPAAQPAPRSVPARKPVTTGIPVSNAPAPATTDPNEITEKDLQTLPLSELRSKLQAAALAGRLT
jgi:hypothetical protein